MRRSSRGEIPNGHVRLIGAALHLRATAGPKQIARLGNRTDILQRPAGFQINASLPDGEVFRIGVKQHIARRGKRIVDPGGGAHANAGVLDVELPGDGLELVVVIALGVVEFGVETAGPYGMAVAVAPAFDAVASPILRGVVVHELQCLHDAGGPIDLLVSGGMTSQLSVIFEGTT